VNFGTGFLFFPDTAFHIPLGFDLLPAILPCFTIVPFPSSPPSVNETGDVDSSLSYLIPPRRPLLVRLSGAALSPPFLPPICFPPFVSRALSFPWSSPPAFSFLPMPFTKTPCVRAHDYFPFSFLLLRFTRSLVLPALAFFFLGSTFPLLVALTRRTSSMVTFVNVNRVALPFQQRRLVPLSLPPTFLP